MTNTSTTLSNSVMSIKNSQQIDIIKSVFTNINQLLVQIQNSYEIKLDKISMSNISQAARVIEKSNMTIINSDFDTIGTDSVFYGGALRIENSNLQLSITKLTN